MEILAYTYALSNILYQIVPILIADPIFYFIIMSQDDELTSCTIHKKEYKQIFKEANFAC